jgi:hypothetical protein
VSRSGLLASGTLLASTAREWVYDKHKLLSAPALDRRKRHGVTAIKREIINQIFFKKRIVALSVTRPQYAAMLFVGTGMRDACLA